MKVCQPKLLGMRCVLAVIALSFSAGAAAGYEINIGSSNSVSIESGEIDADAQIEGIAIINEKVYIDGVQVPRGKRDVISKKSGKHYRIDWGKDGNVTVTEK